MKFPFVASLSLVAITLIGCKHTPESQAAPQSEEPMKSAPNHATNASPDPASKSVAGLEAGWELAPRATYTASQTPGEVIIKANGTTPTAGYEVKLVQSMLRIWPPQYMLAHKKSDGIAAQVLTPFEVTASFKATDPIPAVVVTDVAGRNEVKVDQARD